MRKSRAWGCSSRPSVRNGHRRPRLTATADPPRLAAVTEAQALEAGRVRQLGPTTPYTHEVLQALGYTEGEVLELNREGVV
jgi:hypothetical protein